MLAATLTLVTLAAALPLGQTAGQPATGTPIGTQSLPLNQLQRVEQGIGDQGPMSISLRKPTADLRIPNDFAGVYKIPSNIDSPYAGWYARVAGMGGVVAVFPRSTYRQNPDGTYSATLPPGTQFLVGGIPIGGGGNITTAPQVNPLSVNSRVTEKPAGRATDDAAKRVNQRVVDGIMPADAEANVWRPAPDRVVTRPVIVTPEDPRAFGFNWSELTARMVNEPGYRAGRVASLVEAAIAQDDKTSSQVPQQATTPATPAPQAQVEPTTDATGN